MKAKRTYKDSLFRHIFNDKKRLASLYKALTGDKGYPYHDTERCVLQRY